MPDLASDMEAILIGQPGAIKAIVPYVQMHRSGLAPEGRPAGIFLLLGPTGTGKTKTVEALAEVLHGSHRNMLKIDCGEFQMEHEVAKLVGSPPGYLGHRETPALLNQAKINAVSSESSPLSLILFDEVEKAATSLVRLLLGVLDKAILRLGDNSTVCFDNTLIFLTSNLGSKEIQRANSPDFGFDAMTRRGETASREKLQSVGMNAVRRRFSPEFVNRIDAIVTYSQLTRSDCKQILDHLMQGLERLIFQRLSVRSFRITCTPAGIDFLLDNGTSAEFGARELKRVINKHIIHPVAALVSQARINPGSTVIFGMNDGGEPELRMAAAE